MVVTENSENKMKMGSTTLKNEYLAGHRGALLKSSTQEAEAKKIFPSSRPAWSARCIPGQPGRH